MYVRGKSFGSTSGLSEINIQFQTKFKDKIKRKIFGAKAKREKNEAKPNEKRMHDNQITAKGDIRSSCIASLAS